MVGTFAAKAGVHYTVLLDIKRDGGELNSANPRLVVKLSGANYGEFLGPPLALFGAALLGGLGVLIIATAYLIKLARARRAGHLRRE